MAIVKNLTLTNSSSVLLPSGSTASRPVIQPIIEKFTTVGTTSWTCPQGVTQVEVLVVAGGGAGSRTGSGGGAGGLIYNPAFTVTPGTSYTVTVGNGGQSGEWDASPGSNSVFGSLTAIGGGGGRTHGNNVSNPGGSGAGANNLTTGNFGLGGLPVIGQGYPGGNGAVQASWIAVNAGGGGAGGPGISTDAGNHLGAGNGGPGLNFSISGTPTWYAGGGGGGDINSGLSTRGGIGGGGNGGGDTTGVAGAANTGGGGGGGGYTGTYWLGGLGGSGIVIIKYYQKSDSTNPIGIIRYNTDLRDIEIFEGGSTRWISQNSLKNFAGHNLQGYSQTFTAAQSGWSYSGGAVGTVNATTAPDGSNTGLLIEGTPTGVGGFYIYRNGFPFVGDKRYVESIFFKPFSGANSATEFTYSTRIQSADYATIVVSLTTTTPTITSYNTIIPPEVVPEKNGWYRLIIRGKSTLTSSRNAFYLTPSPTGSKIYLWGAQMEADVDNPGPYCVNASDVVPSIPYVIGNYRIHEFTNVGTTTFTPAVSGSVEVLVVAGGGAGGQDHAGGGGAGGVVYNASYWVTAEQQYTVTVGAGGLRPTGGSQVRNGGNSVFGSITAIGGGAGTGSAVGFAVGPHGGSGGGGGGGYLAGVGVVGQGFPGATNAAGATVGGGGGGAGGPGLISGAGGVGVQYSITGTPVWYGGGGGGSGASVNGTGGLGGGGTNTGYQASTNNGVANTGGGGSGHYGSWGGAGNGGSGVVIVRYKYD